MILQPPPDRACLNAQTGFTDLSVGGEHNRDGRGPGRVASSPAQALGPYADEGAKTVRQPLHVDQNGRGMAQPLPSASPLLRPRERHRSLLAQYPEGRHLTLFSRGGHRLRPT